MKIKILDNLQYQNFPIAEDMVEIDNNLIDKIGISKQFDVQNKTVVDYVNPCIKQDKIKLLKGQLSRLSEDIIQDIVGENVPNIAQRKEEFIKLHNELRILEDKKPREYNI